MRKELTHNKVLESRGEVHTMGHSRQYEVETESANRFFQKTQSKNGKEIFQPNGKDEVEFLPVSDDIQHQKSAHNGEQYPLQDREGSASGMNIIPIGIRGGFFADRFDPSFSFPFH
jgi:hypothetical protein